MIFLFLSGRTAAAYALFKLHGSDASRRLYFIRRRIREEIQTNERELSWAQKDFDTKKVAFEEAQAELEKFKERKTLLTSHLRTIIYDNETKKSEKLSQLMGRLGLGATDDEKKSHFKGFS